jgi:hypothetical protein
MTTNTKEFLVTSLRKKKVFNKLSGDTLQLEKSYRVHDILAF